MLYMPRPIMMTRFLLFLSAYLPMGAVKTSLESDQAEVSKPIWVMDAPRSLAYIGRIGPRMPNPSMAVNMMTPSMLIVRSWFSIYKNP